MLGLRLWQGQALRLVAPGVPVPARVGKLVAQHAHLDGQSGQLNGRCIRGCVSLRRIGWLPVALRCGRIDPVQLHGLDVPLVVLVLGGRNLARLDSPQGWSC